MTDKEPTTEQIKEFWEWCGLKQPHPNCEEEGHMSVPDEYGNWWCLPVELDLNNLFKYAVPKLESEGLQYLLRSMGSDGHMARIIHKRYRVIAEVWDKNSALALFWAIWEVIKEG